MKIVVGSNNLPKKNSVENVFKTVYPDQNIIIESVSAESGVSSHPINSEESIAGALGRVKHAKELIPNADYYVGIEGGLMQASGRAWEIGWVAISNASGEISMGLSSGIELKGKILQAVLDGVELSEVLENFYNIQSAGSKNGFYGIATNDLVTRQAAYEQGITFALAQFLHPELYSD